MKKHMPHPVEKWMIASIAVLVVCVFSCQDVCAQFPSILVPGKRSEESKEKPTVVTAITMDFDMENDIATLLGDVVVDDPDLKVECNRMIIYMEDRKKAEKDASDKVSSPEKSASPDTGKAEKSPESAGKDDDEDDSSGGKQLDRIECMGDVVITTKPDPDKGGEGEQKATAGKAIYYYKTSVIELMDKPVVYTDGKIIYGRTITIYLEQGGRMKITQGRVINQEETLVKEPPR